MGKMRLDQQITVVCIESTAPLIQNAFSQKSVEQMLAKHVGLTTTREFKRPREILENACVRNVKGVTVMPAMAFKLAMLTGSELVKEFEKKSKLMLSFYIKGHGIPIASVNAGGNPYTPRMDIVRNSGIQRKPDIRFRPQLDTWTAKLPIEYFPDLLTQSQVVDLVALAGQVGVGEWRPQKKGTFGTWRVTDEMVPSKEAREIIKACEVPLVTPQIPDWALDLNLDTEDLERLFDGTKAGAKEGMKNIKKKVAAR
jgi:hypothetical protein